MDRGHRPKPAYAGLIGRLTLGQSVSEAEVERLPDPDLSRDAQLLSVRGLWTPRELDEADALLLALTRTFMSTVRRQSGP